MRAWYPAPTRHYVWPPNLRVDFAPTDAATPGVTGRGRFRTNSLGLRSDEPFADARRIVYVLGGSTAADLYLDQEEAWVVPRAARAQPRPGPAPDVGGQPGAPVAGERPQPDPPRPAAAGAPAGGPLRRPRRGQRSPARAQVELPRRAHAGDAPRVGVRAPPARGRPREPAGHRARRALRVADVAADPPRPRPDPRRGGVRGASGSAGRPRRRRTSSTPCPISGRPWPSTAGTSWRSASAPARTARPSCS